MTDRPYSDRQRAAGDVIFLLRLGRRKALAPNLFSDWPTLNFVDEM